MIIIPDIHGRVFWKEVVTNALPNELIIFLGDYLDPYYNELKTDPKFKDIFYLKRDRAIKNFAIENFKEIIEFKKSNSDNVILLLGNHDLGYAASSTICDCRTDRMKFDLIRKLFQDNHELFQMMYTFTENDKPVIVSHAGLHKPYVENYFLNNKESDTSFEYFINKMNDAWKHLDLRCIIDTCSYISTIRGGYDNFGSFVWSDLTEWKYYNEEYPNYDAFQIFGHTRLNTDEGIITSDFACLDCMHGFRYNDGKLTKINI